MIRVSILDDEVYAVNVLKKMVELLDNVVIVEVFTNPYKALEQLPHLQVDVLLLDIDLGERHGIELAELLSREISNMEIIFVTAYPQFALDAFEVSAIDYLLKPVRMNRLQKAIAKAKEKVEMYRKVNSTDSNKTPLFIYAMGSFRLVDAIGNEVLWRTKKVKELFVFLWHFRDKPVHKSKVIEELWPEMRSDKAITLLHTTVYQLRKTLKGTGIHRNPIRLNNGHYQLLLSFNSDISVIQEHLQGKDLCQSTVEKLLNLYVGDYLAEDDYPWAVLEREQIKKSILHVLEAFVEENIHNEAFRFIVEKCLEKMLSLDLYNEDYMFKLMEFYIFINNSQKLKRLYSKVQDICHNDLGIDIPTPIKNLYNSHKN
ncbi:response regulator [Fredinandcohnia humi]